MLHWLDLHAGAIQALSSIATLSVTAALVALTWRYVHLTKTIAQSSHQQASALAASLLAAHERVRESLHAHARRLKTSVQVLAEGVPHFDQLQRFTLISDYDISRLQVLSNEHGGDVQGEAASAGIALRHLVGLSGRVAKINPSYGWSADERETADYATARADAIRHLTAIEVSTKKAAA